MHAPEGSSRKRSSAREAGVQTEVELLGPVEPGSSVLLEGIVWNESAAGARFGVGPLLPLSFIRYHLSPVQL